MSFLNCSGESIRLVKPKTQDPEVLSFRFKSYDPVVAAKKHPAMIGPVPHGNPTQHCKTLDIFPTLQHNNLCRFLLEIDCTQVT